VTEKNCIHEMAPGTCSLCKPRPKKVARTRRPTTTPHSAEDPIAPLSASKDISRPVFEVEPYIGTDWLLRQGYPHDLRPNGLLYLRCAQRLAARVRVRAMQRREDRPTRTGAEGGSFGPGLVFAVDPATWERFDQDLGGDADRMRQGYRYHLTDRSGVVQHLTKGEANPEGDWDLDD
jgi:hypothetical protein